MEENLPQTAERNSANEIHHITHLLGHKQTPKADTMSEWMQEHSNMNKKIE